MSKENESPTVRDPVEPVVSLPLDFALCIDKLLVDVNRSYEGQLEGVSYGAMVLSVHLNELIEKAKAI